MKGKGKMGTLKKRRIIEWGAAAIVSQSVSFGADAGRPNVLFLVADDWNDMVGAMGCSQAITPNLDRLAARGTVFMNAHAPATWCAPSRTAILTGLLPHRTGLYGPQPHMPNIPDHPAIPQLFHSHGYAVFGAGKIYHHMPGYLDLRGFDDYFIWNESHKKRGWTLDAWGDGSPVPPEVPISDMAKYLGMPLWDHYAMPNEDEAKMADTLGADWAAGVLRRKQEKPFFLAYGVYAPHQPNYVPEKYFDLYPLDQIQLPDVDVQELADLPEAVRRQVAHRARRIHEKIVQNDDWRPAVRGYLAAVSYADAMVGRILDALDTSPYKENTIVVFWSDQGWHLGEKTWWGKHSLWQRTTNVPLIWAGPGVAQGAVVESTVGLIDIYRTLTDLCGLDYETELDGQSLAAVLRNPALAKDRIVVITHEDSFAAVNRHWRYIQRPSGEELYDLQTDPEERRNVASNPEYADVIRMLSKALPADRAPAAPGPQGAGLKLITDGESFRWEKVAP